MSCGGGRAEAQATGPKTTRRSKALARESVSCLRGGPLRGTAERPPPSHKNRNRIRPRHLPGRASHVLRGGPLRGTAQRPPRTPPRPRGLRTLSPSYRRVRREGIPDLPVRPGAGHRHRRRRRPLRSGGDGAEERPSPVGLDETVARITKAAEAEGWSVQSVIKLEESVKKNGGPEVRPVRLVNLCQASHAGKIMLDDAPRRSRCSCPARSRSTRSRTGRSGSRP